MFAARFLGLSVTIRYLARVRFDVRYDFIGNQNLNQGQQILKKEHEEIFSREFSDRLRKVISETKLTGQDMAKIGNITKQAFSGYLNTGRVPAATVLHLWVLETGIDANWLLTGEGDMYRSAPSARAVAQLDPIAQRVDQVAQAMREAGVDEMKILAAARDMLEGEMAKLVKVRGGYGVAEAQPGMPRAAEEPACCTDPKKAAGTDTV